MGAMTETEYDSGTYFLEVDTRFLADFGFVTLRTHPSKRGVPVPWVTLSEHLVPAKLIGRAPGQSWPEGFHRPQMVMLPYKGMVPDDYENVFGFELAAQVLLALSRAYNAEVTGVTDRGEEWRDPNPELRGRRMQAHDRMTLLWTRHVVESERKE